MTEQQDSQNKAKQLQWSHENNIEFGYDQVPFIERTRGNQRFYVRFPACSRPPLDWRQECLLAAKEIRESTNLDLTLIMSGGIDSEIVAESFRLSNIPFVALICRFNDGLNSHDIQWALKYCEQHTIPFHFLDLDILRFYQSQEILDLMSLSQCPYPMILAQHKMILEAAQTGHFVITGSSNPCFRFWQDRWYFYSGEQALSLYRLQRKKNIQGLMSFFMWRSELLVSFAKDQEVQEIFAGKYPEVGTNSEDFKFRIYKKYFNVPERPKYKGYEQFQDLHKQCTAQCLAKMPFTFDMQQLWTMADILKLDFKS